MTAQFSPHAAVLIEQLLSRTLLRNESGPLDVACSGGPDSTALGVLAAATNRSVTLHHVDHGLRPSSNEDAVLVKELADFLGVHFVGHIVDVGEGPNLEARARHARRSVLPKGAATGHTMDDQAETVLLNLLRGTGTEGLGAMKPGAHHPLLDLRRRDTHELCGVLGLRVVIDESNDDQRLLRNAVRARLLPLFEELSHRDPVPLLARTATLARGDTELLSGLAKLVLPDPHDVEALREAPKPLSTRVIRDWVISTNVDDEREHPPSEAEVARILEVVNGEVQATEISGGRRVARTSGRLRIEAEASGTLKGVSPDAQQTFAPSWAAHDLGDVVVSSQQIRTRVSELGAQITTDYGDNPPLLVGVLKGAMHFMSDLAQAIELPVDVDFMAVSSYGSATQSSGVVRIVKDLDADLSGRHVLVVEDIIDSGLTLNYLRKYLKARGPASLEVCALLLKDGEQRIEPDFRYVGFTIPPTFVVGYGLDVAEKYRNLDSIYTYVGTDSY